MATSTSCRISIIVPVYNESAGLESFYATLLPIIETVAKKDYEIIYCDDGSSDDTPDIIRHWAATNPRVKLLRLSRNFGKESALSAGIAEAHGQVLIMLDGDGQHPVELIPNFVHVWQAGAQVVVGVRRSNQGEGWFKRFGSKLFYALLNATSDRKLIPGSTDFRLIDRSVQQAFLRLKESDRLTRGLIDWLGFKREYIYFDAHARDRGAPGYDRRKLVKLAANSFVSLTPTPLYLFGYLGGFITIMSLILGTAVLIEQLILGDPWNWNFTGTAMLGILILFLVGLVLLSQTILSLYISHIHSQSKQRPLYIIDYRNSAGIREQD